MSVKKISDLDLVNSVSMDDEFVIIDKSITNGRDSGGGGKTCKTALWQLVDSVNQNLVGVKGQKGNTGEKGDVGVKGERGNFGSKGDKGQRGETGDIGQKGQKGFKGNKGSIGEVESDGSFFKR